MTPKYLYTLTHGNKLYVFTMSDLNRYTLAINSLVGSTDWSVTPMQLVRQTADSATYVSESGEHITVRI